MKNLTQQEIEEGNKLIAEFMGMTIYPEKVAAKNKQGWKWSYNWKGERCDFYNKDIKYHISLDWLMPVIIFLEQQGWKTDILSMATLVYENTLDATAFSSFTGDRITRTWLAVTSAIKFINSKNK